MHRIEPKRKKYFCSFKRFSGNITLVVVIEWAGFFWDTQSCFDSMTSV